MRRIWGLLVVAVVAVVAACSGGESTERKRGEATSGTAEPAKPAPPPMRVALGDCAPPAATFVSGPRPVPPGRGEEEVAPAATPPPGPTSGAFASLTGTGDIGSGIDDATVQGGFGLRGGGGGGTIGLGTIGRNASGFGVGRGGMRGRSAAVPTLSIGQMNAQGALDKAIIRRYVKRNQQRILYCYEKELLAQPALGGTLVTRFTIDGSGAVQHAQVTGVDPGVASCVQQVIASIEFPKPKGGDSVVVSYPMVLRPADPARGQGTIAGSSSPLAAAGAAGGGSATAPAGGSADAPATSTATPYVPGADNPLRGQEAALGECLRKQPRPHGVFVVDLAHEASGPRVLVHGLDGEAGMCVVDLAGKLPKQAAPARRCAVAFGEMPPAEAPAVEITAGELRWLGKPIGAVAALAADARPGRKIDALFEAAGAYARETEAPDTPVALRGPVLLRAIDATPMKVVNRVLATMTLAGVDLVLARSRAGGWKLLRRVGPLPVVPVRAGTGASWNRRLGPTPRDGRPVLSILVTADRISVGVSRSGGSKDLPRTPSGHDLAGLERILDQHKRGAAFAERDDAQIAAEDQVPYGDLASVLELADNLGFTYARVMAPDELSTGPDR